MIRPPQPDFLIVGAPKAGTTALHAALAQHPEVFVSRPEGAEVLALRRRPAAGLARPRRRALPAGVDLAPRRVRRALRSARPTHQVRGESTPFYLWSRGAHRRIAEALPDVRLIAVVRDPVDRAYSQLDAPVVRRPRAGRRLRGRVRPAGRPGAGRLGAVLALPRARAVRRAARPPAPATSTRSGSWCCATATSSTTRRPRSTGPAGSSASRPGPVATIPRDNSRSFVTPGWRPTVLGPVVRAGARLGQFAPPEVWRRASVPLVGAAADRRSRGPPPAAHARAARAAAAGLRRRRRPALRAHRRGLLRLALRPRAAGSFDGAPAGPRPEPRQRTSGDQVVGAVGAGGLDVEAGAAVGQRHGGGVAPGAVGVRRGDRVRSSSATSRSPSQRATPVVSYQFERGVGAAVVQHRQRVARRAPSVTRAPRASQRPGRPASTSPRSVQSRPSALVSRRVVIRSSWPGLGERVAAQPHPPARRPSARTITGSLTATSVVAGQHDLLVPAGGSSSGVARGEAVDPPVLGAGGRAGEVEPPADARAPAPAPGARRTRSRTPRGRTSATCSKRDAVGRPGDDHRTPRPSVSGRRTR